MTELPEDHVGTAKRAETAPRADHVAAGRLRAAEFDRAVAGALVGSNRGEAGEG
ncbi:hypothetical protein [Nocardia amamiensis]|uniref:hypothetical protein n=1 Tax=Nocardia amamiensis TaxID=404578 RepID=UPI000A725E6E|nr:hypothetical protein [Nocardia amamiensis]